MSVTIEAPSDDFRARRAAVTFSDVKNPAAFGVRVRCADNALEILDENNEIPVGQPDH